MSNNFACRCSKKYARRCDLTMKWALEKLNATPSNFLSKAVGYLSWKHDIEITRIYVDQWFGISARSYTPDQNYTIFVQCDQLEDGLAFILRSIEKHGRTARTS